jgi:DNA repair ATPase RecN
VTEASTESSLEVKRAMRARLVQLASGATRVKRDLKASLARLRKRVKKASRVLTAYRARTAKMVHLVVTVKRATLDFLV